MLFVDFWSPCWCTKVVHQHGDGGDGGAETVCRTDLRLGEIVSLLVFYNISFSWLFSFNGLEFIFLWRDSENDLIEFSFLLPLHDLIIINELSKRILL